MPRQAACQGSNEAQRSGNGNRPTGGRLAENGRLTNRAGAQRRQPAEGCPKGGRSPATMGAFGG